MMQQRKEWEKIDAGYICKGCRYEDRYVRLFYGPRASAAGKKFVFMVYLQTREVQKQIWLEVPKLIPHAFRNGLRSHAFFANFSRHLKNKLKEIIPFVWSIH